MCDPKFSSSITPFQQKVDVQQWIAFRVSMTLKKWKSDTTNGNKNCYLKNVAMVKKKEKVLLSTCKDILGNYT